MTTEGGAGNNGMVFKMNVDGSGFTNLHDFAAGSGVSAGNGEYPWYSGVTLSGTNLYGMTDLGGASGNGVIFRMNTDGTSYTNLHEFADGANDGKHPHGSLTLLGTTLYGMTYDGGTSNNGVVFALRMGPWIAAADLGNGWYWSSWFGYFNASHDPWIFHLQHGWMYCIGTDPSSLWLYDLSMGWLWTGSTTYSYLYSSSDNAWLWYEVGTASPRWFYNFKTAQWEHH